MIIRPASRTDAPKIAEIWNEMITGTLFTFTTALKEASSIAGLIAQGQSFFVAEVEGEVVGFSTFSQFRNGPGYANSMEHSIVIREGFSGQKIGAHLMEAVEKKALSDGHRTMIAGISSVNSRAQAFHQKQGYVYAGTLKDVGYKDDRWLDLILMQKML